MTTATHNGTEAKVRGYILENFLFSDDESSLASDASFLEQGIVDSTGVLEIVLFLEEGFGIKVNDYEMTPENLDSVNNIVAFIHRKTAQAPMLGAEQSGA